jgi:hypothetical protein
MQTMTCRCKQNVGYPTAPSVSRPGASTYDPWAGCGPPFQEVIYCNVDDEALLGNDPVTQQWKGSDRCYATAQYTGVNNGVEDVFCGRCGS